MGRIPEHVIEQIKESNDIVDVVSSYISLTRKGQNYWARCPFHQEKTASFSVSQSKQIYHCFGCGAGGNVINFVMTYEKITFPEALHALADRAGISLEEYTYQPSDEEKSISSRLYELHRLAIDVYKNTLKSPEGKAAREYLIKRGLDEHTLSTFEIGFAPDAWDTLLKTALKKKFDENLLILSGLVTESERKKRYDRFRNRIMFPVFDTRGNPVGFGGRVLTGDDQGAKYLNSPETPVYHKSRILYGLHKSRDAIRKADTVLIVEGYMDLLQLWQNGFTHIIAASGTAFTSDHARIIKRFASKAVLCYDGDEAGQKAAVKTGLILAPQGISCRVLRLPEKEDPDSFIRQAGPEAFQMKINEAPDFMSYIESLIKPLRLSAARRSDAVRRILDQLGPFADPVMEEMFLSDLGRVFGTDMAVLKQQLNRSGFRDKEDTVYVGPVEKEKHFANKSEAAQYQLIQLLVNTSSTSIRSAALRVLKEDLFTHAFLKRVYQQIQPILRKQIQISPSSLAESVKDDTVQRFIFRLIMEGNPFKEPKKTFLDCLARLGEQKIRDQLNLIGEKLREADKKGEFPGALLKEKQTLLKKLKSLQDTLTADIFREEEE
ncbi:TPA: DNA primase [Candidatus Marinimicrobia bacterium]|nr:DNA primase [Candidatus Neomarinimicrobiota bacterium]HBY17671.1 DNA primase [Candidatus Neomarinimicrobiota bacterium]